MIGTSLKNELTENELKEGFSKNRFLINPTAYSSVNLVSHSIST